MTVELSVDTQKLLAEYMKAGGFTDSNAAISAALSEGLTTEAADDELLELLDEAEEDVRQGRVHPWEQVRDEISRAFLDG